jgi:hypothetical protein
MSGPLRQRSSKNYFLPLPFFLSSAAATTGAAITSSTGSTMVAMVMSLRPWVTIFTPGQLDVAGVQGGTLFDFAQVHLDELGQLHGQALDLDLGHDVVDQALVDLDGRRILFAHEVQRHLLVQAGLLVHALEVHVQDLRLVGVVLHIAQQTFWTVPASSMSRMEAWKASFFRACHRAL